MNHAPYILLALALAACSSSAQPPCAGVVVAGRPTWTAASDQPDCAWLVNAYTRLQLAPPLDVDGATCTAAFTSSTADANTVVACDVSPDGAADCVATVSGAEVGSGSCNLRLQVRP